MYKNKTIISLIPCRGQSKGVPRKNIRLVGNKPLIVWSIEHSLNSKLIDRTIASTEDKEIAEISRKFGAEVIERPMELALDETPTAPVVLHVLEKLREKNYHVDYVVLLEPTSPFRRREDIDKAIKKIVDENIDSLVSVYEHYAILWKRNGTPLNFTLEKRERRQDKKWEYAENGAIFILKVDVFEKEKCIPCGTVTFYEMPKIISVDIDEPMDLKYAEFLLQQPEIREMLEE